MFAFVRRARVPFMTDSVRHPFRRAVRRFPVEWLRTWLDCPLDRQHGAAAWKLAAGRLLGSDRVALDLHAYQELRRESLAHDSDFCLSLADTVPLAAKEMVRLLPASARQRIAEEVRASAGLPDDDDCLDELIADELFCSTGDATSVRRTLAGCSLVRAGFLPEGIANSRLLRQRLLVHWLEDQ